MPKTYHIYLNDKCLFKNLNEEEFHMKEPIVRFDKRPIGKSHVHRNTDNRVVTRSNFNTIRKRFSWNEYL